MVDDNYSFLVVEGN